MKILKTLTLFTLLIGSAFAQTWDNQVFLREGEQVILAWEDEPLSPGADPTIDSYKIYRQIGATGTTSLLAQVAATVREYTFTMPGGKTVEYRIRIVSVASDGTISPATNEFLITRKK